MRRGFPALREWTPSLRTPPALRPPKYENTFLRGFERGSEMKIRIKGNIDFYTKPGPVLEQFVVDLTIEGPDGLGRLLNACASLAERANASEEAAERKKG